MSTAEAAGQATKPKNEPLLRVEDLEVAFATEDGVVQAVDGVSFDLKPGEVLAIVGESGSGKSVTAMTLMGLTRSPNAKFAGTAHYQDKELIGASEDELRKVRGAEIAMVFQDPMTSLNPVLKIGDQIMEQIQEHEALPDGAGPRAGDRAARACGNPARPRAHRQLSVRVLGRHAPARDDRASAVVRSVGPDRGRAHHGARRDDPGPDPPADPRAARGDRRGRDPGDARPRRGGGHRGPDRGHVRRPDHRGGHPRPDLLRPPAPLHVGAARVDHARGPPTPGAPARHQGPAALAGESARGLPLPPALPA